MEGQCKDGTLVHRVLESEDHFVGKYPRVVVYSLWPSPLWEREWQRRVWQQIPETAAAQQDCPNWAAEPPNLAQREWDFHSLTQPRSLPSPVALLCCLQPDLLCCTDVTARAAPPARPASVPASGVSLGWHRGQRRVRGQQGNGSVLPRKAFAQELHRLCTGQQQPWALASPLCVLVTLGKEKHFPLSLHV